MFGAAAGTVAGAAAFSGRSEALATRATTNSKSRPVTVTAKYFPRPAAQHEKAFELVGKLAVITGASRGIGRAAGEALMAQGVTVIGTSRDPSSVPHPPNFPLLPLDLSDTASIQQFVSSLTQHPSFVGRGQIDILVNNAGRYVLGQIVPSGDTDINADFLAGRELGVRTNYLGHVALTTALLPFMAKTDYSRMIFTASAASYQEGWTSPVNSLLEIYHETKAAMRVYANHLDTFFQNSDSLIRVSAISPYLFATPIADGPNPIYTQPVNPSNGYLSDADEAFNRGVGILRLLQGNGLDTSLSGEAFVQIAELADPPKNVAAASDSLLLAIQGGNALLEGGFADENDEAAISFVGGRR